MPNEASDEALALLWQLGVLRAADMLVIRHDTNMIWRAGKKLEGQAAMAEKAKELTQETWLKVHSNIHEFDPFLGRGSFRKWLYAILANTISDYFRRSVRRREVTDSDISPQHVDSDECGSLVEACAVTRDPGLDADRMQTLIDNFRNSLSFNDGIALDAILTLDPPSNRELSAQHGRKPDTWSNIKSSVRSRLRDFLTQKILITATIVVYE